MERSALTVRTISFCLIRGFKRDEFNSLLGPKGGPEIDKCSAEDHANCKELLKDLLFEMHYKTSSLRGFSCYFYAFFLKHSS